MRKILKFQADWCQPCHALSPTVKLISEETGVPVQEVDIDLHRDMVEYFSVQSVPTLILLEDDKEIARHQGNSPKRQILANLGLNS
jgi:thioredoxin 1